MMIINVLKSVFLTAFMYSSFFLLAIEKRNFRFEMKKCLCQNLDKKCDPIEFSTSSIVTSSRQ